MRKYKILNLYACLGGNRAKWDEVAEKLGISHAFTLTDTIVRMETVYAVIAFVALAMDTSLQGETVKASRILSIWRI